MLIMRNVPSIAISILICASFGLEAAETQQVLTLTKAQEIALQKHPKISVAELKSHDAHEAAALPQIQFDAPGQEPLQEIGVRFVVDDRQSSPLRGEEDS